MNFDDKAKDWDKDLKKKSFECIEDRIILSLQKEQDSLVKNYPLFMVVLKKK